MSDEKVDNNWRIGKIINILGCTEFDILYKVEEAADAFRENSEIRDILGCHPAFVKQTIKDLVESDENKTKTIATLTQTISDKEAKVASLQKEVTALKKSINNLVEVNADYEEHISNLEEQVESLSDELDAEIKEDINNVEKDFHPTQEDLTKFATELGLVIKEGFKLDWDNFKSLIKNGVKVATEYDLMGMDWDEEEFQRRGDEIQELNYQLAVTKALLKLTEYHLGREKRKNKKINSEDFN